MIWDPSGALSSALVPARWDVRVAAAAQALWCTRHGGGVILGMGCVPSHLTVSTDARRKGQADLNGVGPGTAARRRVENPRRPNCQRQKERRHVPERPRSERST